MPMVDGGVEKHIYELTNDIGDISHLELFLSEEGSLYHECMTRHLSDCFNHGSGMASSRNGRDDYVPFLDTTTNSLPRAPLYSARSNALQNIETPDPWALPSVFSNDVALSFPDGGLPRYEDDDARGWPTPNVKAEDQEGEQVERVTTDCRFVWISAESVRSDGVNEFIDAGEPFFHDCKSFVDCVVHLCCWTIDFVKQHGPNGVVLHYLQSQIRRKSATMLYRRFSWHIGIIEFLEALRVLLRVPCLASWRILVPEFADSYSIPRRRYGGDEKSCGDATVKPAYIPQTVWDRWGEPGRVSSGPSGRDEKEISGRSRVFSVMYRGHDMESAQQFLASKLISFDGREAVSSGEAHDEEYMKQRRLLAATTLGTPCCTWVRLDGRLNAPFVGLVIVRIWNIIREYPGSTVNGVAPHLALFDFCEVDFLLSAMVLEGILSAEILDDDGAVDQNTSLSYFAHSAGAALQPFLALLHPNNSALANAAE
eukprot:GHVS01071613.1.p1 GENE.GHVS01071613.1~~GHVS01071613.1.p1  ORF type:complete len:483 (+),score=28.48 GHVS01071613.1:52-1500(+)